jgi:hypothetical protein
VNEKLNDYIFSFKVLRVEDVVKTQDYFMTLLNWHRKSDFVVGMEDSFPHFGKNLHEQILGNRFFFFGT